MDSLIEEKNIKKLKKKQPYRFKVGVKSGEYVNLVGVDLRPIDGVDEKKISKAAAILRALEFAMVEAAQSGHPGGSSGKTEQFLSMTLSGLMSFDPLDPKNPGRDRVVWSAGHCSPLLYAGLALYYEALKKTGNKFSAKRLNAVMAADLKKFRRPDGPQGHIESHYPLSDFSTGPSGHGFPAASGMAVVHKSVGLDTKVWVFMGDAESEEGMTYEARNLMSTMGMNNLIVSFSYNHYGIDGDIAEVISTPIVNHWLALGWNLIEVDGHNVRELVHAYTKAASGFGNDRPTVILAHTIKGKYYGQLENTARSHGKALNHDEYARTVSKLGFNIPAIEGKVNQDMKMIIKELDLDLARYIQKRLRLAKKNILPEAKSLSKMKNKLKRRKFKSGTSIKRPSQLPQELVFEQGTKVSTRRASGVFFAWLMRQSAFFWAGAGDLSHSVLTDKAEEVYGLINADNPYGRGIRYGIAEQNMAMMGSAMTHDRLPGGYRPISVFGSYGAFTNMMCNSIRLTLISNHLCPKAKGFFIALASHDGPETGEDGPTHHGLYWSGLYQALPGIKVYKPLDANETIEMLFHALRIGEPIVLSVARPDSEVFVRQGAVAQAHAAVDGSYIFKNFGKNNNKKITLVISGGILLSNILSVLPELERDLNVKIVAVTSPELFEQMKKINPKKAEVVFSAQDSHRAILLHNGCIRFLYPFYNNAFSAERLIGVDTYLKSGSAEEVYRLAGLDPQSLLQRIGRAAKKI